MDQLRALAARAAAEVIPLDQSHLQTSSGGIQGDTTASGSCTDDQEIVFLSIEIIS